MSYAKLNQEIEKYLKANNLPWSGKSTDTKEETEKRLSAYRHGRDTIRDKWLKEKKYKKLISCVHGGWFNEKEFLVPLAEHFVIEDNLNCLKFLCERGIRFAIKDTLSVLKLAQEEYPNCTLEDILSIDLDEYKASKEYDCIAEVTKWRQEALNKLDKYLDFLKQVDSGDYLKTVIDIRERTATLEVKKKDLNTIKYKL